MSVPSHDATSDSDSNCDSDSGSDSDSSSDFDEVSLHDIALIVNGPYVQGQEDTSDAHSIAFSISLSLDTCRMGTKWTPVLYDRTTRECATLFAHPTFAQFVQNNIGEERAKFESDRRAFDGFASQLAKDMAMVSIPLSDVDQFALVYVGGVAWEWITHWCDANRRSTGSIVRKTLASEDLGALESFGWGDLLRITSAGTCGTCGRVAKKTCLGEGCTQKYCSQKCQKKDWLRHKALCQEPVAANGNMKVDATPFVIFLRGDDRGGDAFCQMMLEDKPTTGVWRRVVELCNM